MTKEEEAIQVLRHIIQVADTSDCGIKEIDGIDEEALEMAIKALEHPERNVVAVVPCGDTISRQAVLDELNKWDWQELYLPIHFKENIIDVVPSVNPQEPCNDAISRQAVKDKYRERLVNANTMDEMPCDMFTEKEGEV